MMRFALVASLLAFATPALADPAPPAPPPPAPTFDVQVDITDAGATAPSFTGTLAITAEDCGALEASTATGHYRVKVCVDTRRGAPHLALDLDRDLARGKDVVHQKVQTTARVEPGKRVVLGRFGQGNDTTEISATVK
jgi:hypothetical protein